MKIPTLDSDFTGFKSGNLFIGCGDRIRTCDLRVMRHQRDASEVNTRLMSRDILNFLRQDATIEAKVAPVSHDKHRISISDLKFFPDFLQVRWRQAVKVLDTLIVIGAFLH